ncbi:MAG: sugar phosphate isomerase/epimerase [Candidatus Omnitrophica bacterium]|nr:sugar phosphate isomerase/epimerase [Candidatus Omnitrophota bacterium]
MEFNQTRRRFLQTTAAMGVALSARSQRVVAQSSGKSPFHKAVITSHPDRNKLEEIHTAGFDGVEVSLSSNLVSKAEAEEVKKIGEEIGARVHSVLRGWANFNVPEKAQEDFDYTVGTLKAAQGYGADAVLVVPGRVGGMPMPEKWGFDVEFDKSTGHVTKVGDGEPKYDEYKKAHNQAWEAFQEWVPKLIPVAEETGVAVALENVWNNLFINPEHYQLFIDSFDSPWIRVYFDVANHMAYGNPSEKWIRVLGDRIVKVHIKDYKVKPGEGEKEWVDLREGSVNFPEVMKALREVGYDGWLTIEGSGGLPYEEQNKRLEAIIAGT